uniref:16S rRNA (Guanine(966)-N(2))-methyltransferase RsmD n=1 Tax=Schlesneria paludicola TaxID=360056 RepID=A0A7C4LMX1_9PLAN
MRIIAGRLRHRKLLTNPGCTTRPIIDRAKVMLFDLIRDRLPGARVADLFCGTGTLGFEALSRGARSVVFIERDHRAYELLVQNAERLHVRQESLCWRVDVARCSLKPKGNDDWLPYDVVFFDPPYAAVAELRAGGALRRCLIRLLRSDITSPTVLLVMRVPRDAEVELPPGWRIVQEREIASMRMVLAEKDPAAAAADDHSENDSV